MRLLTTVLAWSIASGCYTQDPPANGLDGELDFTAPSSWLAPVDAAVAASTVIAVSRGNGGSQTCVIGKGGDRCEGGSYTPVVLDTATCGAGCTATIVGVGQVAVVESVPGDFVLAVTAHASHGSDTWHDRFPLHADVAKSIAVVSADREPVGAAYATEVGAQMPLYLCLLPTETPTAGAGDLQCLGGDFEQQLAIHGTNAQIGNITIPDDDPTGPAHQPFGVTMAGPGLAYLEIGALGLSRTLALRAVTPSQWQRIEFVPFDYAAGDVRDIGDGGFLGTPITDLTLDQSTFGTDYMAATAVLADGSRALLSASRIACQPATRVAAKQLNLSNRPAVWTPDGAGLWATLVDVPDYTQVSPGDAKCVVTGYEALGSLIVHVQ